MNAERMTQRVQEALNEAYQRALREHHTQATVEHLFAALRARDRGLAPVILRQAGADPADVSRRVEDELRNLPRLSGTNADQAQVSFAPQLSRVLSKADEEAKALKDDYVSVEHVL